MDHLLEHELVGRLLMGATVARVLGVEKAVADLVRWAVMVLETEARLRQLEPVCGGPGRDTASEWYV